MKIIFTTLMLLSTYVCFADIKEVIINTEETIRPRSITQKPLVFIDDQLFTLSIQFTFPQESFTVTITDETGCLVTQFQGVSSESLQGFPLPNSCSGLLNIVIKTNTQTFFGEIDISKK